MQPQLSTTTMLDLALAYNARGWALFPCRARETVDPHTGEIHSTKTPYTSNGLKGATRSTRIIKEWWRRTPDAMVGVPTGRAIGVWVLDLDVKPGVGDGRDWLSDMEAKHGELPATARVRTMSGGTHILFRHVEGIRNRGNLGTCVDVRGDGGYIIAPGSVAGDGRRYEITDGSLDEIADAPQWLLDLVLPPATPAASGDYSYTRGENTAYVEGALEAEIMNLASTGQGNRGFQLNASAFSLGQIVGAGALERGRAERELWNAAVSNGLVATDGESRVSKAIKRGLEAGMRQPRDIPEPEFANDNTRLVDVSRMLAKGKAKAKKAADHTTDRSGGCQAAEAQAVERHAITVAAQTAEDTQPNEDTVDEEPPVLAATPFQWKDPKTLPRREFAYGTHYIRKYVSVTVSPGGLGKTSNSIAEALAMASGKPLLGVKPPTRMKVWLFNAEDPRDEMERRIMAACIHYRLKPEDVEGYLFLDTGREQELVVAREDKKTGVRIVEPVVESVVSQIERYGIDAMVVDPFVSTHQVNENDNGAIDKVAKLWAQIADYTNCSIDVVHHLRKVADREATVEDARGAVSLIGAARSVRVLNRMSEEQATQAGVPLEDRFSYFNIHQGKSNLTKLSAAQDWRKMESVPLGNGRGLAKPQDHAGVVTEWRWPSKEEIADAVPADKLELVRVRLKNQDYRASEQSEDWAGYVVAEIMGADLPISKAMTPEKRRYKKLIDAWVEADILRIEKVPNPKKAGHTVQVLRPV